MVVSDVRKVIDPALLAALQADLIEGEAVEMANPDIYTFTYRDQIVYRLTLDYQTYINARPGVPANVHTVKLIPTYGMGVSARRFKVNADGSLNLARCCKAAAEMVTGLRSHHQEIIRQHDTRAIFLSRVAAILQRVGYVTADASAHDLSGKLFTSDRRLTIWVNHNTCSVYLRGSRLVPQGEQSEIQWRDLLPEQFEDLLLKLAAGGHVVPLTPSDNPKRTSIEVAIEPPAPTPLDLTTLEEVL